MANGPSCVPTKLLATFANNVVNKLTSDQLANFGIVADNQKEQLLQAIQDLASQRINGELDLNKRDQMLKDVDSFVTLLNTYYSVKKVNEQEYDSTKQEYDNLLQKLQSKDHGQIGTFFVTQNQQDAANALISLFETYPNIVQYTISRNDNKQVESISYVLREPQKADTPSLQQKASDTITAIKSLGEGLDFPTDYEITDGLGHFQYVKGYDLKHIPEGWQRTGRGYYNYNGKRVLSQSVTTDVHGYNPNAEYPVLASPLGDYVDTVGRMVFDKNSSLFDKKGNPVSDSKLERLINTELGKTFTVSGLKNLIQDFQKLEEELKEMWGENIQFISEEVHLFAQVPGQDLWINGKPDLLVVDEKGVVHVVDFKTFKMTNAEAYKNPSASEYGKSRFEDYGQQVSRYIRMLEAHGLKVDHQPRIVLIDTWYDSSDYGTFNRNSKGELREGRAEIYKVEKGQPPLVLQGEQTLGQYSKQNPATREEILAGKQVLYMEPRLHLKYNENGKMSDELAALREGDDLHFNSQVTYERQWEALTEEEKQALAIFGGKPVPVTLAQGVVTYSDEDIEARPDLMSREEIQDLADLIMYKVSRTISALQIGEIIEELPFGNAKKSRYKGRSRYDIIRMAGLDNLLNYAFQVIEAHYREGFPSEEDYKNGNYDENQFYFEDEEDYKNQKSLSEKAWWIINPSTKHREQLIRIGANKLMALEHCIVPIKLDDQELSSTHPKAPSTRLSVANMFDFVPESGDDEAVDTFIDMYLEGLTDAEAWMLNQKNFSPKLSLAQEVRQMYEDLDDMSVDSEGRPQYRMDSYGWGFTIPVDATKAIQATLDVCAACETFEEQMQALRQLATTSDGYWATQIIAKLNTNKNLKKKFYRNFRKDKLTYCICEARFDKETGKRVVDVRIINKKSALDVMKQSLSASFAAGNVGSYNGNSLISKNSKGRFELTGTEDKHLVADQIKKDIRTWRSRLDKVYTFNKAEYPDMSKEEVIAQRMRETKFDGKTVIAGTTEILHGVGILVSEDVVEKYYLLRYKGKATNNVVQLLNACAKIIDALKTQQDNESIPMSLRGLSAYRDYIPVLENLSNSVQEVVEASCYQDGRTYYSYTNPSRLGHIIRNLTDAINDPKKFDQYIKDNFGRYTGWYKSVDGSRWLCDLLEQLTDDHSSAKKALQHKVELSYLGTKYRDLGALGFQLSILHHYWGTEDDRQENKDYRWFAMPTMSNKPTSEFIRMLKYKDEDEIIDKVLMNTFEQEINRIADVLYHYTHHTVATDQMDITDKKLKDAKWSERDIQGLVDRINSHTITVDDLTKLSAITSGAKFHFLWYLNDVVKENRELAERLVSRINKLLTPQTTEQEEQQDTTYEVETNRLVREAIASSMENVVEQELTEMEKLGIFEKELRKDGKEALKYQDEFKGKLGSNKHGQAEEEMRKALREFIWQDIAANINIIEITGGDLAYFGNAVNYQKRIAMMHSPGIHLMHDEEFDDGFLRSIHISDQTVISEITYNAEQALDEYAESSNLSGTEREDYEKMKNIIVDGLRKINSTDGQSFSSPTSMRKKLGLQGEWDDKREEAYTRIRSGNFNINDLGVMVQPTKPFVSTDIARYSGSPTMQLRRTPLQDKSSEYLILLAEALSTGAGKKSKLAGIVKFMEDTAYTANKYNRRGIDTVHFNSVGKVGVGGIINLDTFDAEFAERHKKSGAEELTDDDFTKEQYTDELAEYLHKHVRSYRMGDSVQDKESFDRISDLVAKGILKPEEAFYNPDYVDAVPVEDYIIQQEVPAHFLEHEQLYGSQPRILGVSDITPGTTFQVYNSRTGKTENLDTNELIQEFKELHAANIQESFEAAMEELGFSELQKFIDDYNEQQVNAETIARTIADLPIGTPIRNKVYKRLATLLQGEMSKDAKYGPDLQRACSLLYDTNGNVIDFNIPLMDPIQSKVQSLLNSIIKKTINKQKINGGPLVQATAYDNNLNIVFKDKSGKPLPTFKESRMSVEQYKRFLKQNQAGIAHFEAYAPIPDERLERLMTKEDGSMMTYEEAKASLPAHVWKSLTEMIGYRIPTEDKYSMIPIKIIGFVPKAAGQVIMLPKEITFLTGSDFDIDKLYIMKKAFNYNTQMFSEGQEDNIIKTYLAERKTIGYPEMQEDFHQIIKNAAQTFYRGDNFDWLKGVKEEHKKKANDFAEWFRQHTLKNLFEEYTQLGDSARQNKKVRNNRILDLQWAVLTNADTASKMLNPGNFNPQKKTGKMIHIVKSETINPKTNKPWTWQELSTLSVNELESLLENANPHNTTLPSSKIYFQRQNMQGTQMTGIFANNNVSHAFMSFQKVGFNLQKGKTDNSFMFNNVKIGDPNYVSPYGDYVYLDPQTGFDGMLISKTIASFLAAAVDTAKDPTLADMNINTFTGGVAMVLARIGYDTETIGLFLAQPIIVELSDLFFKKKTDGVYNGEVAIKELAARLGMDDLDDTTSISDSTLSVENFIEHLNDVIDYEDGDNDYQERVLRGFYALFTIAKDLQELTFCTKFNSTTNAVGPTIADTEEDRERVDKFINTMEDSCFYEPQPGETRYTNPKEVIDNDPILSAFYNTTTAAGGASEMIFKHFFPHYFSGFQNVLDEFKTTFIGNKKLNSKLYNTLLNDYLYFLLTYDGRGNDNFAPTLPYTNVDKELLTSSLVAQYKEILEIKDRRPNALLDQSLGNIGLRIREPDQFLPAPILIFNSGQLNSERQQIIRNAWSDLITTDDPNLSQDDNNRIKKFAVNLFFYTLMRNGFGFSPRTLMALASTIVKYNATYAQGYNNYVVGLRSVKEVDKYLAGENSDSNFFIDRYLRQFVQNHSNNRQIVPAIDFEDDILWGGNEEEMLFSVPKDEKHRLYKIMTKENSPKPFITIFRKNNGALSQDLYEVEKVYGKTINTNDASGTVEVRYKKVGKLGLANNFIEYNANDDIEESFFKSLQDTAEAALEDEETNGSEEEKANFAGDSVYDGVSQSKIPWSDITIAMANLEGRQKTDNKYRQALRNMYRAMTPDNPLYAKFVAVAELDQEAMDEINKIKEEQDQCKKL